MNQSAWGSRKYAVQIPRTGHAATRQTAEISGDVATGDAAERQAAAEA